MELEGKVAVITGAASGIGRAIAEEFTRAGASVVVADIRGSEQAAAALGAEAVPVDVSDEESVRAMAATVEDRMGGVDILVNNAALFAETTTGPFETIPPAEWRRVLEVNVLGPNLCAQAVVPSMRRRGGGAILNVSSGTVFKGVPYRLHYVTSKGAVVAFTRSLAKELGTDNIRVNAIAPGFTLSDGVLANRHEFEDHVRSAPTTRSLQRDQTPQDLVGAARFLCGPAAAFVTGQTLVVDGGSAFH